jgi:hypothetical protein
MLGEGGEVVTRQPYRKVWLDHLLSKVYNTRVNGKPSTHLKRNALLCSCYLMFKEREAVA